MTLDQGASRAQAQELDRAAERMGVPSAMLMAVAGFQTARLARRLLGESQQPDPTVAVLAGKGNNGGDGMVAARHLAAWGLRVRCLQMHSSGGAEPMADGLRRAAEATAVAVRRLAAGSPGLREAADWCLTDAALVVDGMLGTGAVGAPRGDLADLIGRVNRCSAVVLSIDLPSGLDCDSGQAPGDCVRADHTLMLGAAKRGCQELGARHWVGRLWLADIGIPRSCYLEAGLEPPEHPGPDPA
ncbi:MAG: NAD(P)H-hydrate epimerase [Candidatus Dormibacteria bacterium]